MSQLSGKLDESVRRARKPGSLSVAPLYENQHYIVYIAPRLAKGDGHGLDCYAVYNTVTEVREAEINTLPNAAIIADQLSAEMQALVDSAQEADQATASENDKESLRSILGL